MDFDLTGRVAIVTGGAQGLGLACCHRAREARRGHRRRGTRAGGGDGRTRPAPRAGERRCRRGRGMGHERPRHHRRRPRQGAGRSHGRARARGVRAHRRPRERRRWELGRDVQGRAAHGTHRARPRRGVPRKRRNDVPVQRRGDARDESSRARAPSSTSPRWPDARRAPTPRRTARRRRASST